MLKTKPQETQQQQKKKKAPNKNAYLFKNFR